MIKKLTAYSFILLANIVLLAHVILPHHYHQQEVCVERANCTSEEDAPVQNTPAQDHQQDCNTNSTSCALKQAIVIPSSQARFTNNCNNCTDTHNHDFYIVSTFGIIDLQTVPKIISYTPELYSFFTTYITPTLGLRAPPIV